ncbi:sulfite exporter TauE/SafE family protein [Lysobacter auxotrophicus]|uniref:Sulfite exporter TauE/SafE family protein n=1 Tax=Lysobacter auxotrophicus TaxID=2992573 RepID=A0ABM8D9Z4_9GAMM|nr:sulfite exporter TauE/SafE family protein [Lysobacter auxotrophicus]BDU15355.1 sulfite exporter TauE/SafE family protein [Lysobacter auxotrophicus]
MPIDWLTLGAASLSGLLGGAHCAAMCGGIATGFSVTSQRGGAVAVKRSIAPALEANLARIGGYVIAGAVAGGLGHGIVGVARLDGLATGLRMLVGLVLVVVALRLFDRRGKLPALGAGARMWTWLRPLQQRMLPADSRAKRVGLAVLWGWLPCGLSTTLLAAAWLQASAVNGALTMLAFGVGTLPVMLPLTWSGARLGRWLQTRWRNAGAALVMVAGLLTLSAPWLMQVPQLHAVLSALGCVTPAA